MRLHPDHRACGRCGHRFTGRPVYSFTFSASRTDGKTLVLDVPSNRYREPGDAQRWCHWCVRRPVVDVQPWEPLF